MTAVVVTGASCDDPTGGHLRTISWRCPLQKVAGLKGHTDPLQLRRPLTPRGLRWLTMTKEESSIDPER